MNNNSISATYCVTSLASYAFSIRPSICTDAVAPRALFARGTLNPTTCDAYITYIGLSNIH